MSYTNKSSKLRLILLGTVVAMMILEAFLKLVSVKDLWGISRALTGEKLTDCVARDRQFHHKLMPNCNGVIKTLDYTVNLATNSLGFRDEEINKKKKDYRVLILGDSFAEGWGVEVDDRFDNVAQEVLTARNKKTEIINAGVRSYSPILALTLLKDKLIDFDPDMVILIFDMSDLHDDFYYGGWQRHFDKVKEIDPGWSAEIEVWPPEYTGLKQILMNSEAFKTVYREVGTSFLNKKHKLTLTNLSWDISIFAKAQGWENFDKAWNLNIANILLMSHFLDQKGIEFAIAVVPRGIYVSDSEWGRGREPLGIEKNKLYEPLPIEIIQKALSIRNIKTIDLYESLGNSGKFPLYYGFDGHWTVEGNRIVGEVLANYLYDI